MRFAFTMGDPCGIGAEIIIKALKSRPEYMRQCIVFGNAEMLALYAQKLNLKQTIHKVSQIDGGGNFKENSLNVLDPYPIPLKDISIGKVSAIGGECAFQYLTKAITAALNKEIAFITTAPLNKEALNLAGHKYAGHTEILSKFCSEENFAMLLWSEKLKCVHISTHISLKEACDIKKERIVKVAKLANGALKQLGFKNPRIATAGLNPHSGENGLFGDEENREIIPAIKELRAENINISDPISPDTVFLRAYKGEFDIVIAMYHDQGHIPLKLLSFDSGVNITLGLPIVRTSVDHGTAFEIAGKFTAKEDSLLEAVRLGLLLKN
jgi:4-hydroxythreonine-4-phosphate dehydrogenase